MPNKNIHTIFIIASGLFFGWLQSCAHSRFVEPLDKGELSVGGDFGGPIIDYSGTPIPIPLTSVEVGYGVDTHLTAYGGLHTTALIFNNFQMDAGVTYQFIEQNKYVPNVSVSPGFNYVHDFNDKINKFWPVLDVNAFWNYGQRKNYFYLGFNNMFELSKTMANGQEQIQPWVWSPQIGHTLKSKSEHWQFTSEIKFLAPNQSNAYAFVPYTSLTGSHGATGVYLGLRYIFK